jgi:hypothetical protein
VRSDFWAARQSSALSASGTATNAAQLKAIFQDTGFVKIALLPAERLAASEEALCSIGLVNC